MDTNLLDKVTNEYKKVKHPNFRVGDIIEVHSKISEGEKERIQVFEGIVIAIKGSGISKTFTVRKISYGIGVEKIFPLYSPNIANIKIIKRGKVKRSKLYYLRKKVGKKALKAGIQIPAEGEDLETQFIEKEKGIQFVVVDARDLGIESEKDAKKTMEEWEKMECPLVLVSGLSKG